MFYLNQLLKIFKEMPVRMILFSATTFLLVTMSSMGDQLTKSALKKVAKVEIPSYMNALISGRENYSRISRKVEGLPGVAQVKILDQKWVLRKMKAALSGIDAQLGEDLNYAGLKIIFKDGLKSNTQKLISDYIVRLAGKDNVTLSKILGGNLTKAKSGKVFLEAWGSYFVIGFLATLWFLSLMSMRRTFSKFSFAIESFQRKSNVQIKMILLLFSLVFTCALGVTTLFGKVQIATLSLILLMSISLIALTYRKIAWQN